MTDYRDRFEHHLLVRVAEAGVAEASTYFKSVFPSVKGDYFECAAAEANKAFLHLSVANSQILRYGSVREQSCAELCPW